MRKFIRNFMIGKDLQVLLYFTLVGAMTHRIKIDWLGNYHLGNSYLLHCKQTNLSFIQSNQSSIHFSFLSIDRLFTSLKRVASLHYNCSRLDFEDSKQILELLIRILFLYYYSWASCSNCQITFCQVKRFLLSFWVQEYMAFKFKKL